MHGDCDILHEVFDKSGLKVKISHPLNKWQVVLNALDRESKQPDALLKKVYCRVGCSQGGGLVRMFIKKESPDEGN